MQNVFQTRSGHLLIMVCLSLLPGINQAAEWQVNELHFQYGELDVPSFAGNPRDDKTLILTYQHASGWHYGDLFLFIDWLHSDENSRFNHRDVYLETYLFLSLEKMLQRDLSDGLIKDVGPLLGVNYALDAKSVKFLPGLRLDLELPGFSFAHLDMMAYLDHSAGTTSAGAPSQSNSYIIDFNWEFPFSLAKTHWSIVGHMEYIGKRKNEFGAPVSSWFLAQPQLRLDLGEWLFETRNQLFVGIEYQYWINKLGDPATDENTVQALLVWRF